MQQCIVPMEKENLSNSNHLHPIQYKHQLLTTDLYMGVSKNRGTPQIIRCSRVFHYKPSILGYHHFWKHPYKHQAPINTSRTAYCAYTGEKRRWLPGNFDCQAFRTKNLWWNHRNSSYCFFFWGIRNNRLAQHTKQATWESLKKVYGLFSAKKVSSVASKWRLALDFSFEMSHLSAPRLGPVRVLLTFTQNVALRFCEIISGVPRPCQKWQQFPCCYTSVFYVFCISVYFLSSGTSFDILNRFCMLKIFPWFQVGFTGSKTWIRHQLIYGPKLSGHQFAVSPSNGVPPTFQVHDVVPPKDGRTNPRMNQGTDFLKMDGSTSWKTHHCKN